ncbi:hypothetical protein SERIO_v1c09870 [Spiroplasma eriocheiris]|uniref:Transmembrane protein n=2 Tax=Spiroplasma eriocheiris TaxID=315358 RepID=A0A0H3XJ16_9MOLU|nr:hypothetical protein SERIO_v1c09870 [Spiroplasma eriocheiris]
MVKIMKKVKFPKKEQKNKERTANLKLLARNKNKIPDETKTNLLEETMMIDEEFSIIKDLKDEDIKVVDMGKTNFYDDNVIDLEEELLKSVNTKKKPQIFKYLMFAILAILVVIMIIIIVIKL